MKWISILFLAILPSILLSGQNVDTYSKTFSYLGQASNTLNQIETSLYVDGRIILVVTAVNDSLGQFLNVVEVDSLGNALNITKISHSCRILYTLPDNSVIHDCDGNFVVVSNAVYLQENPSDGYLVKLNSNLDTLWTKTYDLPPQLAGCPSDTFVKNNFNAIKQCANGDYIIVGSYRLNCQSSSFSDRTYLLRVDKNGGVKWWKTYPNVSGAYDIELSDDDGFFVAAVFYSNSLSLVKLDSLGNILWQIPFNTQTHPSGPFEIESLDDSMMIVASGLWIDLIDYRSSFVLSKINYSSQQILFEKVFQLYYTYECYSVHQDVSLAITENQDIIIGGNAYVINPENTAGGFKGFIFKLDSDGDSIWTKYYSYGDFEDNGQFNDIQLMEDGGFLATGFSEPWGVSINASAWIVRTDSNGYAPGAYPTGIYKPEPIVSYLRIYPNPSKDVSWVDLDILPDNTSSGILSIFDMAGNLMKTEEYFPDTQGHKINTNELKPGLYLVSILLEDGRSYQTKLIVY